MGYFPEKAPLFRRTWPVAETFLPPNGTDDEKGGRSNPVGVDWAHSTVRNNNNSFLFISTHCEGKLLCYGPLDFVLCFLEQARLKLCTLLVLTATTTS